MTLRTIGMNLVLPALALSASLFPSLAYGQAEPAKTPVVTDFSSCAKPKWPVASLRNEETGTVTLSFMVETDGTVSQADVIKSSGFARLDMAVQEGIALCRFKPATEEGKPVRAPAKIQYVWTLEHNSRPSQEKMHAAEAAAHSGDAQAQFQLASFYLDRPRGKRDVPEGVRWLRSAAAQDHKRAAVTLAGMIESGVATGAELADAIDLYKKAASLGDANAQHRLGSMMYYGQGLPKDEAAGLAMLRAAAAQGFSPSATIVANDLLTTGENAGDHAEAVRLLLRGVGNKESNAMVLMAHCLETGKGITLDLSAALKLYRKAAELGNVQAKAALARLAIGT